ncbi:hypothetical protein R0137_09825 [Congregibacter brevis]|uniref:Uncharacterized protein n=1 Tax=Congregibacter brevis TaxID=3081201 RepID=A0ABZ0I933_9GAMM|nr:hypothetical protein R0137_09825 [Congregibacter sp. IMCC45268]
MILRSLTKHVKDQNWFAVLIDFTIVVIGVFIGIQVANWNELRAQEQRDIVLLERLFGDFEQIAEWGERRYPLHVETAEHTRRLIEAIRNDVEPPLDNSTRDWLEASVEVYASFESSPTYDELVATGTLSRIRHAGLRQALNAYAREREADMVLLNQQLQMRDTGPIESAVRFRANSERYGDVLIADSFDWPRLKSTEPHLQKVLRTQVLRNRWHRQELASAREILSIINDSLGSDQ